jgi:tetratricopeptide (TPR) repeat protein
VSEPELVKAALEAVRGDDLEAARAALVIALTAHPERLDLVHTLAIIELQSGQADHALELMEGALSLCAERQSADDLALVPLLCLAKGAAHEELNDPTAALAAYDRILAENPDHPLATQGKGHLLLAWGKVEAGLDTLQGAVDAAQDDPRFLEATAKLIAGVRQFLSDDLHPRNFVDAHQGSYMEFFNHHADAQAVHGWIAEAARMRRGKEGGMVPVIADGARPYAATRVDLVDPATGKAGLIGDQPMIVALAGHEIISQAPIVFEWPGTDFPVWGSSQMPWNLLNITVVFDGPNATEASGAATALDATIGDWYTAGYTGEFGSHDKGRFHSITDPTAMGPHTIRYDLDCGRAEPTAIDDLLKRFMVLNTNHPIKGVLIGRGFAPVD